MTTAALAVRPATSRLAIAAQLTLLVLVAAALQAVLALQNPVPWIVPDELIYSELAKSIAAGDLPAVRGETKLGFGLVYPALIAPAWALFSDVTSAYATARVINSLLMASTAVPAYFLARRFVAHSSALAVATFSVFMPAMLFSGTLLTEVALYPAWVLALLATSTVLERPSLRNQFYVLVMIGVAIGVKALAIAMLPAYVVSVATMAVLLRRTDGGARAYLRRFLPTWVLFGACAMAIVPFGLVFGGARRLLGFNAVVLNNLDLSAIPHWFLVHLAGLDLAVAGGPFFAAIAICGLGLRRPVARETRLYASLVLPGVVCLLLLVAAYSSQPDASLAGYGWSDPEARLRERNMFVLVPLLLIGLAMWLEHRRGSRARWLIGAGLVSAFLPAVLSLSKLEDNAEFQAMSVVPWVLLGKAAAWPLGGIVFVALGVFAVWRGRRRASWAFLGAWFTVVSVAVYGLFWSASNETLKAGFGAKGGATPWIDMSVGGGDVAVVWDEPADRDYASPDLRHRVVWENEFFNRSVGRVYSLGAAMPYSTLPIVRARLKGDGVLLDASGRTVRARYALTCALGLRGAVIERRENDVRLYRLPPGPIRVTSRGRCMEGWQPASRSDRR